jgi:hypothetical protein
MYIKSKYHELLKPIIIDPPTQTTPRLSFAKHKETEEALSQIIPDLMGNVNLFGPSDPAYLTPEGLSLKRQSGSMKTVIFRLRFKPKIDCFAHENASILIAHGDMYDRSGMGINGTIRGSRIDGMWSGTCEQSAFMLFHYYSVLRLFLRDYMEKYLEVYSSKLKERPDVLGHQFSNKTMLCKVVSSSNS